MPIVPDIEFAHKVIDATSEADWGDEIQYSEPQVIVSAAMVVKEAREDLARLEEEVESLKKALEALS